MKRIEFEDSNAQNIYDRYMRRAKRTVKNLPKETRQDILMEMNSHIFGSLSAKKAETSELDIILKITDQLGDPEETLKPMVAHKKLDQATSTFNPIHIANAIFLNLKNGIIYTVYGILYLGIISSFITLLFKIISPGKVGFLVNPNSNSWIIGTTTNEDYVDVLGFWFVPIALGVLLGFYVLLTLLMRFTKKKK